MRKFVLSFQKLQMRRKKIDSFKQFQTVSNIFTSNNQLAFVSLVLIFVTEYKWFLPMASKATLSQGIWDFCSLLFSWEKSKKPLSRKFLALVADLGPIKVYWSTKHWTEWLDQVMLFQLRLGLAQAWLA